MTEHYELHRERIYYGLLHWITSDCTGVPHKLVMESTHTLTLNLKYVVIHHDLLLQRIPELNYSTYSQWLYWADSCCTPTQINEIPKSLVRTVKRDSTWSRPQHTHSQAFLKENCFSGKCPSLGLTHMSRTFEEPYACYDFRLYSHCSHCSNLSPVTSS